MISTAVLSLMLGAFAPAQGQDQHDQQEQGKEKPAEQKEKKAQPEKSARQEDKSAQPAKNAKPEQKSAERQPPTQAPHNESKRIPDDRFRANFGRDHRFRVSEADYRRDRRFQYGGYWLGFAQPWPSNWLYTQDVYVIEINGVYYLCNANYPGVNITLNVTM